MSGSDYAVAAYAVVLFGLVMYLVVVGLRTARIGREAELLARVVAETAPEAAEAPERRESVEV